ncbi:MAG TPA: hypothetical protein VIB48_05040 [Acidimicrobiia bacterium]|jgi:hypothetical protein
MNPYHRGLRRPEFSLSFPTIKTIVAVQNVQAFNLGGGAAVAEGLQQISA